MRRRAASRPRRSPLPGGTRDVGDEPCPARNEGGDTVFPVFKGTVLHEPGVLGGDGNHTEVLEVPGREAGYEDVMYVAGNLAGPEVHVAEHADARLSALG